MATSGMIISKSYRSPLTLLSGHQVVIITGEMVASTQYSFQNVNTSEYSEQVGQRAADFNDMEDFRFQYEQYERRDNCILQNMPLMCCGVVVVYTLVTKRKIVLPFLLKYVAKS